MKATRFNAFTHLPSTLTINHQSVLNSHPWFPVSSVSARQVGDRAYSQTHLRPRFTASAVGPSDTRRVRRAPKGPGPNWGIWGRHNPLLDDGSFPPQDRWRPHRPRSPPGGFRDIR